MMRLAVFFIFTFCLSLCGFAGAPTDSTTQVRLKNLAAKLRLQARKIKENDYEVRIWEKCQLCYGDAHVLYQLTKKEQTFTLYKYIIDSDKYGFRNATRLKPTIPITFDLWERLVQLGVLTLPSESTINNQLRPPNQKDSTWNVIDADGSVSVHAKKKEPSIWILDGESYYFEIFSRDDYRNYNYSNPREYLKAKPKITELRSIVAILDELAIAFRSSR